MTMEVNVSSPALGAVSPSAAISPPVKAMIINLDGTTANIPCLFNPSQYTFDKENAFSPQPVAGANAAPVHRGRGTNAHFALDLWFDTFDTGEDVRVKYTGALWQMTLNDDSLQDAQGNSRPPKVRFQWGESWSFDAWMQSMHQSFTLFATDGTPLRAHVTATLIQLPPDERPTNPSSEGGGPSRVWRVARGETLPLIAFRTYGDANMWRLIADANHLNNVRELVPGTTLDVPYAQ